MGEAEGGGEVLGQVLRLLDGGEDGLVDLLLVRRARLGQGFPLLGLAVGEELLLGRLGALLARGGEVRVRELVVELRFYLEQSNLSEMIKHTLKSPSSTFVEVAMT